MSIFANVRGEIKELYRIFFNDNGVIRELEVLYAQNDNNEVKRIFAYNPNQPEITSWVAYNDNSTVNSVTNNGYTINAYFTNKKRSIATENKIFLFAGTQIRAKMSNTIYSTGVMVSNHFNIYLFSTESDSLESQSSKSDTSSNTLTVQTTGDYYIALSIFGYDAKDIMHYCTTDVNISILPPTNG